MTYTSEYPIFYCATDLCIFTIRNGDLSILLVKRSEEPLGWALPGGFVQPDESFEEAAVRELAEETSVSVQQSHLEQLKGYSAPDRDQRYKDVNGARIISQAFVIFSPDMPEPKAGSDAAEARWWSIEDALDMEGDLAFDHAVIVRDAVERVRSKLEYTTLGTQFLREPFTLPQLRDVYEAVWGVPLNPANFNRKVLKTPGFVVAVDGKGDATDVGGRRPNLYRAGQGTQVQPAMMRSDPSNAVEG